MGHANIQTTWRYQVRSETGMLALMVMLKSFQRLGYFTDLESVPTAIITHLRKCLNPIS